MNCLGGFCEGGVPRWREDGAWSKGKSSLRFGDFGINLQGLRLLDHAGVGFSVLWSLCRFEIEKPLFWAFFVELFCG